MSIFSGSVDNYLFHIERGVGRELTNEERAQLVAMRGAHAFSRNQLINKIIKGKFLWGVTKATKIN